MIRITKLSIAGALASASLCAPAVAQDDITTIKPEIAPKNVSGAEEAEMMAALQQMFQAEPLTAEQEARLPEARAVVVKVLPEGFYGQMMGDMMDSIMQPLFGMVTGPLGARGLIERKVGLEGENLPDLTDEQSEQIVDLLDPKAEQRAEQIQGVLTSFMTDMFARLEPPMRDGLTNAYAVRFSERELGDITAFFATPTGARYASESMAVFADPQVMSAMMQSVPAMLGSLPEMAGELEAAAAELPEARGYDDLSSAERSRLAGLLDLSEVELRQKMAAAAEAEAMADTSRED
ncbi:DUF2059 domain-containing protein [Qipengyuania atrilutea]|uniref:DUF2059 domain-containing protein n=1 Tax=Qipengyuania atrilutea TaxID=2744473 RepID=A0A850GYC3_9SPHN|nr:DUF2059 domain-containing protein [Actirhodobacter atriluteus]NVD44624.1 DUF2059 domain-containing protein [Actirhodobacter atriluteus]